MNDPFELLGLPRRPWLDEGAIRTAFQEQARHWHPDAPGGDADRFAAINAAQAALSEPAVRLQLLVGDAPLPAMPPDPALGFRVGSGIRDADAAAARRAACRTALELALIASDLAAARLALQGLRREVEQSLVSARESLRTLDVQWPDVSPGRLAEAAAEFRFLRRWLVQLRERELALSL